VTGYGALRNRSQPPRVFSSVDGYRFGGYFGLTEDLEVGPPNAAKRSSQELLGLCKFHPILSAKRGGFVRRSPNPVVESQCLSGCLKCIVLSVPLWQGRSRQATYRTVSRELGGVIRIAVGKLCNFFLEVSVLILGDSTGGSDEIYY
jgi:hypothetical protein